MIPWVGYAEISLDHRPAELLLENVMRVAGVLLMVIGAIWVVMCFVGTAMMSRSVDMFSEAFLPSILGFAAAGLGYWLFQRARGELT